MGSHPTDAYRSILDELLQPRLGYLMHPWPTPVEMAVREIAREMNATPEEALRRILGQRDQKAIDRLVGAATITHSGFFRHPQQLSHLRDVTLPRLWRDKHREVRIWCVGCARGQEAYTLALCAEDVGVPVSILATDVNPEAIRTAKRGRYAPRDCARLSDLAAERGWEAPAHIRNRIRFEVSSLIDADPACGKGSFDLIFCRNVLIYFHRDAVPALLSQLATRLAFDGALVVSPAETTLPIEEPLVWMDVPGWLCRRKGTRAHAPPALPRARPVETPLAVLRAKQDDKTPAAEPRTAEHVLDRSARELSSGQPEVAEALLRSHLERDTDDAQGWLLLGEALAQREQRVQARTAFLRAAKCAQSADYMGAETMQRAANRRAAAMAQE